MSSSEVTDSQLLENLKNDPAYRHVCLCGFGAPAADKGRQSKCCRVCPGCNQRIKNGHLKGHLETCVAYGQVTGKIPVDNSWWMTDDHLRRRSFGQPHIFRVNEGIERRKYGKRA